jgi:hypothetical protein
VSTGSSCTCFALLTGFPSRTSSPPSERRGISLTEELLAEAALEEGTARRLFGDLVYRSAALEGTLAESGLLLVTERSRQHAKRQQVEIALASLKREFHLEETLATTLVGPVTRIVAKVTAYTYGFLVNRLLGRPQGRIKELWARDPRNTHLDEHILDTLIF